MTNDQMKSVHDDIAYMRCIPKMVVAAPMNEQELRNMMYTASQEGAGPFTIRYPRGEGVGVSMPERGEILQIGKGRGADNSAQQQRSGCFRYQIVLPVLSLHQYGGVSSCCYIPAG